MALWRSVGREEGGCSENWSMVSGEGSEETVGFPEDTETECANGVLRGCT